MGRTTGEGPKPLIVADVAMDIRLQLASSNHIFIPAVPSGLRRPTQRTRSFAPSGMIAIVAAPNVSRCPTA